MILNSFHILVVEDNPIVAEDILDCLRQLGYTDLSRALTGEEAQKVLEEDLPDLAFLDINLGKGMSGVDLANLINTEYRIPFIYLTAHSDDLTLTAVKETLPAGFVMKPFHEQRLKSAIEIARHNYYAVIRPHWSQPEDLNRKLVDPLTRRELDLLDLLCQGKSNRELAETLFVSINTIKTHLKNLYLKLEVRNRAEAIVKVRSIA